jgi:flagellar hook protein FlgE
LGISGEGFFRVRDTLQGLEYVTRAGDFRVDDQGYLVTNSGFRVQGIGLAADEVDADGNGVPDGEFTVNSGLDYANLRDIRIDYRNDDPNAPRMESYQIDQGGNVNIFLSDGTSMVRGKILLQRFQDTGALVKEGDNLYSGIADAGPTEDWPASRAPGVLSAQIDPTLTAGPTGAVGSITAANTTTYTLTTSVAMTPDALVGGIITITGAGAGTYMISANTANTLTLQAYGADPADWTTTGAPDATSSFTTTQPPSAYRSLAAAQNGNGRIISGSIEMSNVDLTSEFANMITTQRAFQAASKLITTSDEILQDIVNLKR